MEETSHAPQADADRRDEREVVARGALVSDMALGQLDENIAAEQRAEDRFAGGKLQPHIRRAEMQPAFRKEVDNFRAEERADQGRAINENKTPVLTGAFFPKEKADDNAGKQQPRVRRDCHEKLQGAAI